MNMKGNGYGGAIRSLVILLGLALTGFLRAGEELPEPSGKYGYLGVYIEAVPEIVSKQLGLDAGVGLVIVGVAEDGPAAQAGLEKHDILLKYDDQILMAVKQGVMLVRNGEIGSEHVITYLRGGKEAQATVVIGEGKAKKKSSDEHGFFMPAVPAPPMPPIPASLPEEEKARLKEEFAHVQKEIAKAQKEIARARVEIRKAGLDGAIESAFVYEMDDEMDMIRSEELQTLIERVTQAVESVDGMNEPTIVFESDEQVFEFKDEEGNRYVIAGVGEQRQLSVVDSEGEVSYSGELDEKAKELLPDLVKKQLPHIEKIVATKAVDWVEAPVAPSRGVESF
ncbi:PDZ domain-containing protein [Pelagicoccus albus]|uniref:PDZ domain-containing protein n=1 Tax=Pelagicoccus albus TaxID=415222 RepID=A0A7X1B8R4_9BACT|nr:PDZ domain-containing protein [Pelagicoccus albus]MBC2607434.1 PDZ domain-containing protein [Pelagicoccus albus]